MAVPIKSKTEVQYLIRKAYKKDGLTTTNMKKVIKFLDKMNTNHNLSPELLAYFIQKINAFELSRVFENSGNTMIYPTINLLDVNDIGASFGWDNLLKTVNNNILKTMSHSNKDVEPMSKKAHKYQHLRKTAAKKNLNKKPEKDPAFDELRKFTASKLESKYNDLSEKYASLRGLDSFIASSRLNKKSRYRKVLDKLKDKTYVATSIKKATLTDYIKFKDSIDEILALESSTGSPNQ